jgi:uncharacterized Zn-binding protein involved in type VI secretion
MPGFLLHVGATAICPHAGQVTIIPSSPRVLVSGQPVATLADTTLVAGCAFTVLPAKPQPCIKVQWTAGAEHVLVGGRPALLRTGPGLCLSAEQIPAGAPTVIVGQVRVRGT